MRSVNPPRPRAVVVSTVGTRGRDKMRETANSNCDTTRLRAHLAERTSPRYSATYVEARLTGEGTPWPACGASSTVRAPYGEMGVRVPHARTPQCGLHEQRPSRFRLRLAA